MLKQKLFVLGVAAMVLMLAGCSDDSTSSSSNTVCKVGQKECTEDGKERVCEATGWVTYDCPEGQTCEDGGCVGGGDVGDCTEAEFKPVCSGDDSARIVCEGSKTTTKPCDAEQKCVDGVCKPLNACEGDTKKCSGDKTVEKCVSGYWKTEVCEGEGVVCSEGQCVLEVNIVPCLGTEPECLGGERYAACEAGVRVEKSCDPGLVCEGGVCKNSGEPDEGCDASFEPYCTEDGRAVTCPSGTRVTVECVDHETKCEGGACVPITCGDAYVGSCKDEHTLRVCRSGVVGTEPCPSEELCVDDECRPLKEGDTCEEFSNTCLDGTAYLKCSETTHMIEKISCDSSEVCLNGMCSKCDPKTFSAECVEDDETRTTWLSCVEDEHTPGLYVIKKNACPKSSPVCLAGDCVQCDPATYKPFCSDAQESKCDATGNIVATPCADGLKCVEGFAECTNKCATAGDCPASSPVCVDNTCVQCDPTTYRPFCSDAQESKCDATGNIVVTPCADGLKCVDGFAECTNKCASATDCPTRDDGLTYACIANNCELQTECDISTAKPTCSGDKRKICQDPGKWVEAACDGGKVCMGEGECVACTRDEHCPGSNVCDTATHTCVACNVDKDCGATNVCLDHVCAECNPDTYGEYKCLNESQISVCTSSGHIVKMDCPANGPVCVDDMCHACNGYTDAGKKTCDFPGYEGKELTCQADHRMTWRECPANETCKSDKGCVSKCGDTFAPSCANINERYVCDASGNKVKESCWPYVCSGGECTNVCSGNIDKCGEYSGYTGLRHCTDGKVGFLVARSNEFCGTVDGKLGVYEKCTAGEYSFGLKDDACATYECKAGAGRDYLGNSQATWVTIPAFCDTSDGKNYSLSCYKTADGELMERRIGCQGTCSEGICSNWKIWPNAIPTTDVLYCQPVVGAASNYYQIGGTIYRDTIECYTLKANGYSNPKCEIHRDDYGNRVSTCDHVYSNGGTNYTMAGVCVGKTLYHLYVFKTAEGISMSIKGQTCSNKCKTTSTGWAYCGN